MRYIDADAAIVRATKVIKDDDLAYDVKEAINSVPTAEVKPTDDDIFNYLMSRNQVILTQELLTELCRKPVVRGEWIPVTNERGGFECSECHSYAPSYQSGDDNLSNYCPNCGCQMVKGEDNE